MKLQTQFSCWQLAFFPCLRRDWVVWIPQRRDAGELGNSFLEQLQSFANQHRLYCSEPRDVSPWARETFNQPKRNRIRPGVKNDGDRPGNVLAGYSSRRRGREEYVNFETDQLVSQGGEPVKFTLRV